MYIRGAVTFVLTYLVYLFTVCSCGMTISFCDNAKKGGWEHRLTEMLLEVPFTVDGVYCAGVTSDHYGIQVMHSPGVTEVVSVPAEKSTEDAFLANIISKLSSQFITTVTEPIDDVLNGVDEAVVAYVQNTSSHNTMMFRQAVLSPALPKHFKVFELSNSDLLPSNVQQHVRNDLHVWIVTDGQWSHLLLPYRNKVFQDILHHLIGVFINLQHPVKVSYESEAVLDKYIKEGFNLLTVYHRSNQLKEVQRDIIDPLANVFRPYYVFITHDIDKHPPPQDIPSRGPYPYIVTKRQGQTEGVHISSAHTELSVQTITDILNSILDPLVNNVEPSHPPKGMIVSRIDSESLESIVKKEKSTIVAILCEEGGSSECDLMEDRTNRAIIGIQKTHQDYNTHLYIVEYTGSVSMVTVPHLPCIIVKNSSGEWSVFSETVTVTMIMRAVQENGRQTLFSATNEPAGSSFESDYYDSFEELKEDESMVKQFGQYLVVPHTLPILTIENYTSFMEENKNCIISFYLKYCHSSKAVVYHFIEVTEELKKAGMAPAVVNCGDYPDVCEAFEVYQYPTVKYRKGYSGQWTEYQGILNGNGLVRLAHGHLLEENEQDTKETGIIELTPAQLMKILKGTGLTNLLVLVSDDVTPDLHSTMQYITDHRVYWLNSTLYSKLSQFFIGLHLFDPPVLVWADYDKGSIYRLDLKKAVTQEIVVNFISSIVSGIATPDDEIKPNMWRPKSPPILFPSQRFMSQNDAKYRNTQYDYQEGDDGIVEPYEDHSYGSESVNMDRTYKSEGASVHSTNGGHQEL